MYNKHQRTKTLFVVRQSEMEAHAFLHKLAQGITISFSFQYSKVQKPKVIENKNQKKRTIIRLICQLRNFKAFRQET